jgi:cyclopropane fatty-acyl-phospholipid synthase-like methyltransferase
MRTGIWVAEYLDPERYHGIDAHLPGLEAAVRYEIPLHGLQNKKPRLLNNDQFDVGHFGVQFDWIFSFAVVNHLSDDLLDTAFRRIREYLKPSGRLVLSPAPRKALDWIKNRHGFQLCHSEETPCLFIDDEIAWFEFQPKLSESNT